MRRVDHLAACAALALAPDTILAQAFAQCEPDLVTRLVASDGLEGDTFGFSVAVGGGLLAIGAPGDEYGSVYVLNADDGQFLRSMQTPDELYGRNFGAAIAMEGPIAVIGASNINWGSAYVYDMATGNRLAVLQGSGGTHGQFGWAVDLCGGVAIVGAYNDDQQGTNAGAAFIHDAGSGNRLHLLYSPDPEAQDRFGSAVAICGDRAVVGASGDDDAAVASGAAYVFDVGSGAFIRKLVVADAVGGELLGGRVALEGNLAAITARGDRQLGDAAGAVYVFDVETGQQVHKLVADDGGPFDYFGESVTIRDGLIVIGAVRDNDRPGVAYLFDAISGEQLARLEPSEGHTDDEFGYSVALGEERLAVGAMRDSALGQFAGAAYLYEICGDSDGDGLKDDWEINGIPYTDINGDGQRFMLPGADPMHKDLYLEIDAMAGFAVQGTAVNLLVDAFADAPLSNPDGHLGVDVHILRDDTDLPHVAQWTVSGCWPDDFATYKAAYYGSDAERNDPSRDSILAAKAKAYRYMIAADRSAPTSWGGCADISGDNSVVFLGAMSGNAEEEAALIMHELGHNLGLRHGGGDSINGKPNYPSIMNYAMSYRWTWNRDFWELDYSREDAGDLTSLLESALDENEGIGSPNGEYSSVAMPFGVDVPDGNGGFNREVRYVWLDGSATDFGDTMGTETQDGSFDVGVLQDLNYVANPPPGIGLPSSPSPGQLLRPHDDWGAIELATAESRDSSGAGYPEDELTEEAIAWIEQNFPPPPGGCAADFNGDGVVDTRDVLAFLNAWSSQDSSADFNGDGLIDTRDVLAFLNAWAAGC